MVHEQAAKNTEISQNESKEKHDIKAKDSDFLLGEQVLLKVHKVRPGFTKKFQDKYTGPFYIRDKGPYDTYKIADCRNDKCVKNYINAQDLKRYYDPLNYRHEPPEGDIFETDSDADTIIYDPNEIDDNELEIDRVSNEKETAKKEHNVEHAENKKNQTVKREKWYSVNKILRQRKVVPTKQFFA